MTQGTVQTRGRLAETAWAAARSSRRRTHRLAGAGSLALPPVLMLAAALCRIGVPSLSGDEAASVSAARRSLPELCRMLGHTDAVHGAYYLLLWVVIRVLGTGELAVRLPSALAMSAAAAGVAAIGRRLVSRRAGLAAGLALVAFPVSSGYGQDARSYAIVLALAVLASYLLVRVLESGTAERRWMAGYGLALAVLGWMNLMAALIVVAHAATLALRAASRGGVSVRPARLWAHWLAAVMFAAAAVSPLAGLAWGQRHDTARFLRLTSFGLLMHVPGRLTESLSVLIAAATVSAAGLALGRSAPTGLASLGLPWLLIPAAVLLGAGAFAPVFDARYILFCAPALALLTGAALDAIAAAVTARGAPLAPGSAAGTARGAAAIVAAGLTLIGALGLPAQLAERGPDGHQQNARLVAAVLAADKRPGDAVLYFPVWWRLLQAAYPGGFAGLRDIALAESPVQAANLAGTDLPVSQQRSRLDAVSRAWLVGEGRFRPDPALSGGGWTKVTRWQAGLSYVILYRHGSPAARAKIRHALARHAPDVRVVATTGTDTGVMDQVRDLGGEP